MTAHLEAVQPSRVSAQAPAVVSIATKVSTATAQAAPEVLGLKIAVSRYDVATVEAIAGKEVLVSFEDRTQTPIDYEDIPHDDIAMIFRAVDALRHHLNRSPEGSGVDITIQKNIPFETHLGGRGAATAAVLVAVANLWTPSLAREDLLRIAHTLGNDVVAAMSGGAMITQQSEQEHYVTQVLVHHPVALVLVPAAADVTDVEMFEKLQDLSATKADDELGFEFASELLQALSQGDAEQIALMMHNDFQSALVHLLPEHNDWLNAGMAEGALAAQTVDRGPSLVFVAEDLHHAEELAERFAERMEIAAVAETGPVTGAHILTS